MWRSFPGRSRTDGSYPCCRRVWHWIVGKADPTSVWFACSWKTCGCWGLPTVPRKFAELNLRFYVRPSHGSDDRKGVVFLRQMVSSRLVALAGRVFFREPMLATPMTYKCEPPERENRRDRQRVYYRWTDGGHDAGLRVTAGGDSYFAEPGSLDEFLTHRYWGYNRTSAGRLRAYRISREPWPLVPVIDHELKCDPESLYGPEIADVIAGPAGIGPVGAGFKEPSAPTD